MAQIQSWIFYRIPMKRFRNWNFTDLIYALSQPNPTRAKASTALLWQNIHCFLSRHHYALHSVFLLFILWKVRQLFVQQDIRNIFEWYLLARVPIRIIMENTDTYSNFNIYVSTCLRQQSRFLKQIEQLWVQLPVLPKSINYTKNWSFNKQKKIFFGHNIIDLRGITLSL